MVTCSLEHYRLQAVLQFCFSAGKEVCTTSITSFPCFRGFHGYSVRLSRKLKRSNHCELGSTVVARSHACSPEQQLSPLFTPLPPTSASLLLCLLWKQWRRRQQPLSVQNPYLQQTWSRGVSIRGALLGVWVSELPCSVGHTFLLRGLKTGLSVFDWILILLQIIRH